MIKLFFLVVAVAVMGTVAGMLSSLINVIPRTMETGWQNNLPAKSNLTDKPVLDLNTNKLKNTEDTKNKRQIIFRGSRKLQTNQCVFNFSCW